MSVCDFVHMSVCEFVCVCVRACVCVCDCVHMKVDGQVLVLSA